MKQIAFIGLGHMGAPMATNLLKAGYLLNVFDLVQSAVDGLVAAGASAARSARDAVQAPTWSSACCRPASTSRPVPRRRWPARAHRPRHPGARMLDHRPDLGAQGPRRRPRARPGDARRAGVRRHCRRGSRHPDLHGRRRRRSPGEGPAAVRGHGSQHLPCRPRRAGQVAKVCNNQLLAVLMIGTAEAMALGVANGLDAKVLAEIMRRSSGGNWALEVYNPGRGLWRTLRRRATTAAASWPS